jgi:hypothetical protein
MTGLLVIVISESVAIGPLDVRLGDNRTGMKNTIILSWKEIMQILSRIINVRGRATNHHNDAEACLRVASSTQNPT